MTEGGSALLDPELLAQLERLQLVNRRRLTGSVMGEHLSPRRGPSLDFADYRDYYPGDDMRRLDVAALARLDRMLLKLYDAEDDMTVRLLVDTSGSMAGEKLERALQLAAALGFVALTRRDEVTVQEFPPAGYPRRFRGRGSVGELFGHLAGLKAAGRTILTEAADRLVAQRGTPGLVVVVSDLLTPDWKDGLRRLAVRRADLAVVHLLHPSDLAPTLEGDLELVDTETAARMEVSLTADVIADYRRLAGAWAEDVAAFVRSRGGAYARVLSSEPVESILLRRARDARVLR